MANEFAIEVRRLLGLQDQDQWKAVCDQSRVSMVVGEPGSGKTHVICAKMLRLLGEQNASPVVTCFAASTEALDRIRNQFREWIETCSRITSDSDSSAARAAKWVVRWSERAQSVTYLTPELCALNRARVPRRPGYDSHLSVWGRDRAMSCLARVAARSGLGEPPSTAELAEMLAWRQRNLSVSVKPPAFGDAGRTGEVRPDEAGPESDIKYWVKHVPAPNDSWEGLMREFEQEMERQRALDWDNLVPDYVGQHAGVRPSSPGFWSHVLVDGVHDMTQMDLDLILQWVGEPDTITVTAYDRQGVGSWRGVEPSNGDRFLRMMPDAVVHHLPVNHRATEAFGDFLSGLKTSFAFGDANCRFVREGGTAPRTGIKYDLDELFEELTSSILEQREKGTSPKEMAVLFRSSHLMMEFGRMLARRDLRYRVMGEDGSRWKDEVASAYNLLQLMVNPYDLEALCVAAGARVRGSWQPLNDGVAEDIRDISRRDNVSIVEAARRQVRRLRANGRWRVSLNRVVNGIEELSESWQPSGTNLYLRELWSEACRLVQPEQGGIAQCTDIDRPMPADIDVWTPEGAWPPVQQVRLTYLARWLDDHQREKPFLDDRDAITMSTIRGAAGMEWKAVWVLLLGRRVSAFNNQAVEQGTGEVNVEQQEEQHMYYQAATRARDFLYILGAYDV